MPAICPECDSPIDVDQYDVDIGDELTCSECGTLLRVSNDAPLEFEAADDLDEDDDDDEDTAVADDAEAEGDDGEDDFEDDDDEDDDRDDE